MHTATNPSPTPPTSVLNGLGQALRWLRERQARKQYQVASAAGITKGMLSAYETGRQRPSLETLEKLLETLGCDLNDVHNALQIVNGRPEQMKGWRGGLGASPPVEAMGATRLPAWPDDLAAGIPSYGAHYSPTGPLASEVHEVDAVNQAPPPRGRTLPGMADLHHLHQILGLLGGEPSPAALQSPASPQPPTPALPAEEELALAQMLEGFHNLLRYWHRCLTALVAAGQAAPPAAPAAVPPASGKPEDPGPAATPRSRSR